MIEIFGFLSLCTYFWFVWLKKKKKGSNLTWCTDVPINSYFLKMPVNSKLLKKSSRCQWNRFCTVRIAKVKSITRRLFCASFLCFWTERLITFLCTTTQLGINDPTLTLFINISELREFSGLLRFWIHKSKHFITVLKFESSHKTAKP